MAKFPHLADFAALQIGEADLGKVRIALKGQVAVEARTAEGPVDAAGLQIPGVLDDLYTYDGPLGVTFEEGVPTLARLGAHRAHGAAAVCLSALTPTADPTRSPCAPIRKPECGALLAKKIGTASYYLYEVQVYTPATGGVVTNLVTDPYTVSLTTNSTLSQIIDLNDPATMPEGWSDLAKSWYRRSRGHHHLRTAHSRLQRQRRRAYLKNTAALTLPSPISILPVCTIWRQLADAGLTHLHLLPSFDIATIEEDRSELGQRLTRQSWSVCPLIPKSSKPSSRAWGPGCFQLGL